MGNNKAMRSNIGLIMEFKVTPTPEDAWRFVNTRSESGWLPNQYEDQNTKCLGTIAIKSNNKGHL